jgi:hypothetical protein
VRYDPEVSPPPGDDDDEVPRLPRGKGFKLSRGELLRIAMTAGVLVAIIVLAKPCADATSRFVAGFDNPDASTKPIPKPDEVVIPGSSGIQVNLEGLTPEQQKAAIEEAFARAKALTAGDAAAGSAYGSGSASGSGTGSGPSP